MSSLMQIFISVELFFTRSQGQPSVERGGGGGGFSVNKSVLAHNVASNSIVPSRILKDRMFSNDLKPHTTVITNKLMQGVKSS